MPSLAPEVRGFLRQYRATNEWLAWASWFDQQPATAYAACKRADWLMRVAEEYGVSRQELVKIAAPMVNEYSKTYLEPLVGARALDYAIHWSNGEMDEGESHQAAHEAQAASRMIDACGHLAHACAHICNHPAQAIECCILAAEQADFGRGREEGRRAAEARTLAHVRERLPLSRILE